VIALDLFASWCETCQELAPEGEALWPDHGDDGFVLLAVMQENQAAPPPPPT